MIDPDSVQVLEGVQDDDHGNLPVELVMEGGRWMVRAWNNGGVGFTLVYLAQLLDWLKNNRPDLLAACGLSAKASDSIQAASDIKIASLASLLAVQVECRSYSTLLLGTKDLPKEFPGEDAIIFRVDHALGPYLRKVFMGVALEALRLSREKGE